MIRILVPTRGRPARAKAMLESALETAAGLDDVRIHLLVDDNDPELEAYQALAGELVTVEVGPRVGYTGSLNRAAAALWADPGVVILGAFGDDVLFRTPGWDDHVRAALATPGMAYADDKIHGRNHPSAVFMRAELAQALGWLALPVTTHQWADDGWKRLGQATGSLRYMDGVVIEHMHPAVGKAEWDATYEGVFESERAKADYEGFTGWMEGGGLDRDALVVRQVLDAAAAEAGSRSEVTRKLLGRRRPDTPRDQLPPDVRPGDYWKVLNVGTGEPAHNDSPSNLTGTVWEIVAPDTGFEVATLAVHTVREEEDGTISVRPGDGSSNSILVTGAHGKQWHGYIEHGEWHAV